MSMRNLLAVCAAAMLGGCSLTPELPSVGTDHPANPDAAAGAFEEPSPILSTDQPVPDPDMGSHPKETSQ